MKRQFLKSVLLISSVAALMSCSEEAVDAIANNIPDQSLVTSSADASAPNVLTATEPCFVFNTDNQTYLINGNLEVKTAAGEIVGSYDGATMTIKNLAGVTMFESVDISALEYKDVGEVIPTVIAPASSASSLPNETASTSSASLQDNNQNQTATSSATQQNNQNQTATSSAAQQNNNQNQTATSSAAQQNNQPQQGSDGTCFDKLSNKYVKPYTELVGKNGEKYAYKNDCSIDCWWDGSNNNCANIGSGNGSNNNNNNNNQQQPQSSNSQQQAKSSASQQAKSSASQQPASSASNTNNGTTPNFKIVSGGKSGSGYATRYWDSCKPHCAWKGKAGPASTPTRTCHADGSLAGADEKSACDGGTAGTCLSQIPQVINDNLAYAFAATPGGEGDCGRCYLLTFDGNGHDQNPARNKALANKKLVVMSSNIGYDVAGGQFDLMIPGGGVGAFSGCRVMGLSCNGKQYGGLLGTCQDKYNNSTDKLLDCLKSSCKTEYGNNTQAYEGCMFMATWMNGADNPTLKYQEIECPSELSARW